MMLDILMFLATAALSVACLYAYFPIAEKSGMLAGVNHRSSHIKPVVTGAGFIFVLSFAMYMMDLLIKGEPCPWFFAAGFFILAIVSFCDDVKDVWFLYRLLVQLAGIGLMLLQLSFDVQEGFGASPLRWIAILCMVFYAMVNINLYNFMDGINGMMGCLTLATIIPAMLVNMYVIEYMDNSIFLYLLLPTAIFLFFNFRRQPKCFSGDVGSITVGFTLTYIVLSLVLATGNMVYLFLMAVVYIDAGLTVAQRLFAGQNIFKPHRIHLFQLLCNENKHNHLLVSSAYCGVQLAYGLLIFALNYYEVEYYVQYIICTVIFAVACVAYLLAKRNIMGGHLLDMDARFVKQCDE